MKPEKIENIEKAVESGKNLPFAFIRNFSSIYLGKNTQNIDVDELLEARFFSKNEEIRILRINGDFLCSIRSDEAGDEDFIEKKYRVANENFGKTITVRRYIRYDEDGQASLSEPRLCGWEGDE